MLTACSVLEASKNALERTRQKQEISTGNCIGKPSKSIFRHGPVVLRGVRYVYMSSSSDQTV